MIIQYEHYETQKPAIAVATTKLVDTAIEVKSVGDMPALRIWEQVNFPPELISQGDTAIHGFLKAFHSGESTFFVNFFPSGYPDGKLPFSL